MENNKVPPASLNNKTNLTEEINNEYSKYKSDYFRKQLEKPYRSTEKFFDLLENENLIRQESVIIDACCGSGANSFYALKRFNCKS